MDAPAEELPSFRDIKSAVARRQNRPPRDEAVFEARLEAVRLALNEGAE